MAAFVAQREAKLYAGQQHGMPIFEKNWLAMSYQLQALRCPGKRAHVEIREA